MARNGVIRTPMPRRGCSAAGAMFVDAPADGVRSGRMKRVQRVFEVLERGCVLSLARMIPVTEFVRTSRVRRIFKQGACFLPRS